MTFIVSCHLLLRMPGKDGNGLKLAKIWDNLFKF